MAAITTFQDLFYSQLETQDNPNPRLASPIEADDLTIPLTAPVQNNSAADPNKPFLLVIRNSQTNYPEGIFVQAGELSADLKTITLASTAQRGLPFAGEGTIDFLGGVAANRSDHPQDSEVRISVSALSQEMVAQALKGEISSTIKLADRLGFDTPVPLNVPVFADATARDAAITSPQNGDQVYVTALNAFTDYTNGVWSTRATGTATPDASETVKGIVELADAAEMAASTSVGGTGARLINPTDRNVVTSAGAGDASKQVVTDASGQIDTSLKGSTYAEENQALSGISANVTSTNLDTLTAGTSSFADGLHSHNEFISSSAFSDPTASVSIPAGATKVIINMQYGVSTAPLYGGQQVQLFSSDLTTVTLQESSNNPTIAVTITFTWSAPNINITTGGSTNDYSGTMYFFK